MTIHLPLGILYLRAFSRQGVAFDQKVSDRVGFAKAFDDDDDRGVSLGKESLLGGLGSHCHVSFVRREGGARRGAPESRRRLTSEARALLAMVVTS